MKRIYHHYKKWEDYQHGLYTKTTGKDEKHDEVLTKQCASLLSDQNWFFRIAREMIHNWPNSADVNLTNPSRNKQAWIGQASCCYALGAPEFITKFAWNQLSPLQRIEANKTADVIIKMWLESHHAK